MKPEVALPPQLGSLSRGVLVLDLLGNLWGAGAPKLEVDHLRLPPELASGIGDHHLLCYLLRHAVVSDYTMWMVAVGVCGLHDMAHLRCSFTKQTWWTARFQKKALPLPSSLSVI